MRIARPIFGAMLGALFAAAAAPAAGQDPEIISELQDLCVEDSERQSINLIMTAGPVFAPLAERGVVGWDAPGYLVYASVGEQGPYMTPWQRSFVPLAAVRGRIGLARNIWFRCPESEKCVFRDGNTLNLLDYGPLFRTLTIGCRNPERVLQLLDTWIDRNVTRTPGVPPFTE